ncbi:winged helix-turn-helix domain-containing protein [Aeromonas veronii]|uniref:winged helix-turn-helix domain-containing protein n=1 Tax=Aeromonas veronii TaxID=654 RepID=UPI003BA29016
MIHGKVRFDTSLYSLIRDDGVEIRLSKMEVEVLSILCELSRQTVTRQYLFDHAWPNDTGSDGHLNRVILLLRRKFDSLGLFEVIKTIPKVGYIVGDADNCENSSNDVVEIFTEPDVVDDVGHVASNLQSYTLADAHNVDSNDKNVSHGIFKGRYFSPRFILLGAGVIVTSFLLYSIFVQGLFRDSISVNASKKVGSGFRVYNFYSNDKVSLYSTMKLNNEIQEKIGELVGTNLRDKFGRYYITISKKAISVLHMSNEHRSLQKMIYLRGHRGLVEELSCIINVTDDESGEVAIVSEHIDKNSITKSFSSLVSPTCPVDHLQLLHINISTTVSSDAAERDDTDRNRFFYMTLNGSSHDINNVFSVSTTGYVEYYMDDGVTYEKWNAKAKNINGLSPGFNGDPVTIKFIDDISNRDTPFITRRITEGVYVSDILGGVIISSR